MKNIFVGNLDFNATESSVRSLFEPYGNVERVNLITDRDTGRSRGFAFGNERFRRGGPRHCCPERNGTGRPRAEHQRGPAEAAGRRRVRGFVPWWWPRLRRTPPAARASLVRDSESDYGGRRGEAGRRAKEDNRAYAFPHVIQEASERDCPDGEATGKGSQTSAAQTGRRGASGARNCADGRSDARSGRGYTRSGRILDGRRIVATEVRAQHS